MNEIAVVEHVDKCPLCGDTRLRCIAGGIALWECQACGYVFHSPRPTKDAVITYYSSTGNFDERESGLAVRDIIFRQRVLSAFLRRRGFDVLHSGPDPFTGLTTFYHTVGYPLSHIANAVTGVNLYEASVFVARKASTSS